MFRFKSESLIPSDTYLYTNTHTHITYIHGLKNCIWIWKISGEIDGKSPQMQIQIWRNHDKNKFKKNITNDAIDMIVT